jgi:hypothetical protein
MYRALTQYRRINVPEITSEDDEEPFEQLLRSYALSAHLNNVLIDISANENYLRTSRLLESAREILALIDYTLSQATPSQTDVVLEFSKIFNVATEILPFNSQFATEETSESPQILFEYINAARIIARTDQISKLYSYRAGKIKIKDNSFDVNDTVSVAAVDLIYNVDWVAGATIPDTLNNITDAINTSTNELLFGLVGAINDGVDTISVIPLDDSVESIPITESDGATDNFDVESAQFGADKSGEASTPALLFNLLNSLTIQRRMKNLTL